MVFGGGTFRTLLGQEGGALMNGISALVKETQRTLLPLLPLLPCEDTGRRGRSSLDTKSAGALILDFQPPEL